MHPSVVTGGSLTVEDDDVGNSDDDDEEEEDSGYYWSDGDILYLFHSLQPPRAHELVHRM